MTYKIKLIVAGGREFTDQTLAFKWLDFLLQNNQPSEVQILCGKARGTGIRYFPAKWKDITTPPVKIRSNAYGEYNVLAGIVRNHDMGDNATHLLAFWDGVSTGTKDMIDYATKLGLVVKVVRY